MGISNFENASTNFIPFGEKETMDTKLRFAQTKLEELTKTSQNP